MVRGELAVAVARARRCVGDGARDAEVRVLVLAKVGDAARLLQQRRHLREALQVCLHSAKVVQLTILRR